MSRTCESCQHSGIILNTEKVTALVCKRYPPTACGALLIANGQPVWQSATVWPAVERGDACGEYAAAEPRLVASGLNSTLRR